MTMRDASEKGLGVLWTQNDWDMSVEGEQEVTFPANMLQCAVIGREITFFSEKPI